MLAAHIAGVPVEETLLFLGGPAAISLAAATLLATVRRLAARLAALARRSARVDGR